MILKHDYNKFLQYVEDNDATICGYLPIAVMIKALDIKKSKLLKYYQSSDVVEDKENSVSYASIVMYG